MADAPLYSERLIDALAVAARLHAGQRRKGSDIPYLSHLLGTCAIALDYGAGEDEAIAALLHDAIEDVQPTVVARAAVAAFGPEVLRIVEGCTDSDTHPKPPWRDRKQAYVAHVADLSLGHDHPIGNQHDLIADQIHFLEHVARDDDVLSLGGPGAK